MIVHTTRFQGLFAGIVVFAVMLSLWVFVAVALPHAAKGVQAQQNKLHNWSNSRIRSELGEATQVADCQSLGMPQGLTCRIYVNQGQQRIIVLATP
jgi:hypothetical protein